MNKRVLVVSAGLFHPTVTGRRRLAEIIRGHGRIEPVTVSRIGSLTRLSEGTFDAAVLYFHRRHIGDGALSALDRFVTGGGGLLAVHGASASFKKNQRYFDILGGRFVSHGTIEPYTVVRTGWADPAFTVTDPFTVTDELYIHNYRDDTTIQYVTQTKDGLEPVVWTRTYGKGRICYVSLGHVAAVLQNDAVRRIISDALTYILGAGREGHNG
jgi:type 1 glutamine amidotransferase